MISAFLLNILLPATLACGPASGGISNKALLHFNLAPPPKYTYSDSPSHGQMTSARAAESNADRDLQLAILSTLAENGIMADTVKLSYQYSAPKLYLAKGNHCTEPNTFVVYDGAIMYKCVAAPVRGKRSRVKRADEETTSTEGTTVTVGSTVTNAEETTTVTAASETATESTEITAATDGTTGTVESTAATSEDPMIVTSTAVTENTSESIQTTPTPPGTETDEPTSIVPETPATAIPETTTATREEPVETVEFQIVGAVTVETPQPIFENQWRMFAEKIQEKLEEHHVFFTGAVIVEMF